MLHGGNPCFKILFNGGSGGKHHKGSQFAASDPAHTIKAANAVGRGTGGFPFSPEQTPHHPYRGWDAPVSHSQPAGSEAKGNMNLGNDKAFLIRVVSQCLPYIGYPRSLNAVACDNKAAEG